ncbi:histidine kinase [Massilia sp. IC2-477]|uniref:sensor histidine kinase n=1 Tax=Massilia sp. IC2-477 TaxID=2887198 RepID=UPI001D108C5C|nr:sensor histidine kinase [Massilia sp. IC2-477]MCC2957583.1 histidine kinase [Massilia sp. IC2-477]
MLRLLPILAITSAFLVGPASARGLKDYQRTVWTQQQGAPTDITGMAQTRDGWLWIGSGDGLLRFDGVSFEPYTPPGGAKYAHLRVVEMYAADNGDLYVSYFPAGVAVVRRDGSFTPLPQPREHLRTPPVSMVVDHDNTLWTIGDGIRRFANGSWTKVETGPDWSKAAFYSMLVDQDNRLWAAAPTGVWLLDRARGRFTKVSEHGGGLAVRPTGEVWLLGIDGGLSIRLAESQTKARPARAGAVTSRRAGQFTADGTLWSLACPETACLVHQPVWQGTPLRTGEVANERVPSAEGAAGQETVSILEDREGNVWIRAHNGLNQFRPKRFLVPSPALELDDFFYTAGADRAGRMWIAEPLSGKLWRLGEDGVPVLEPGPPVHLVAGNRNGTLLKADKRSITRVAGDIVETIPLPPGRDGKPVDRELWGMLDDGKRIWTAASDTGLIAWSDGKWRSSRELGMPSGINISEAAGPGQLWVSLINGELLFLDDGKSTRYDASGVGVVTGIFPDQQLVLGGTDGLGVLKNGKLRLLHGATADALRGVSGIAVTADGDRWLNGVSGVVRVRAADWQRALAQPEEPLRYELFGVTDGYPGRSSIGRRRPTAFSPDGRHMWFIATRGIVGLDSADLRRNAAPPRPVVLEIATDETRYEAVRRLQLPPGSQSFRVRFTAPSLRQPGRTRFEFRLDGVDSGWRDAGTRRTTSYTNVAPGNYVFRVRAFNEDGVMSQEDAVVPITIEPTWVQSLPFKLSLAIALVALLGLLYRLRIRHLTRRITERVEIKMAERERIARTLHDTFLQTVYLLLLRLKKFEGKLPEHEEARQELRSILGEAQRVMDEGRDQVHDLRTDAARTLEETVRDCADRLLPLHAKVEFDLRSKGTTSGLPRSIGDEAGAIACEAVRNAFTHAQAHRILVEISCSGHALVVTVSDDGRGLPDEVAQSGRRDGHWGIVGMRERAAHIGARLEIQGGAAGGTTVTLEVPLLRNDS